MRSKLFFLAAVFFCFSFAYAEDLKDQILEHREYCVAFKKNDKLYFYPNVVFPREEGIYIAIDENEYVLTPYIHLDSDGYYLQCKDRKAKKGSGKKKSKKNRQNSQTKKPKQEPKVAEQRPPKEEPISGEKTITKDTEPGQQPEQVLIGESKNEVVLFKEDPQANKEQVWDQEGNELAEEEIEKLPETEWEAPQFESQPS